jgi:hypothetical protein
MRFHATIGKFVNVALLVSVAIALSPQSAHADATCNALIQSKIDNLNANGGFYVIELTMHREEERSWVFYGRGQLWLSGAQLAGSSYQIFSDRQNYWNGQWQPFDIHEADQITFTLNSNGLLSVHNVTWGFDESWDFSCPGNLLTTYLPHAAVVTLTFRSWESP